MPWAPTSGTGWPRVTGALVTCPSCGEPGFAFRYLDRSGNLLRAEHRTSGRLVWLGDTVVQGATIQVTAWFRANLSGAWRIGLAAVGACSISLNGELFFDDVVQPETDNFAFDFLLPQSGRSPGR